MPAAIYDWKRWLRIGSKVELVRGRDYLCPQSSMSQQVRMAASRLGLSVSVEDLGDKLIVSASKHKPKRMKVEDLFG